MDLWHQCCLLACFSVVLIVWTKLETSDKIRTCGRHNKTKFRGVLTVFEFSNEIGAANLQYMSLSFTLFCFPAATFVSLLLEVESTYEVHDYIRSFLGETDEVHAFAKQFLDNRQKLKKNQQKKTHQVCCVC